jgi:hypothetical protein
LGRFGKGRERGLCSSCPGVLAGKGRKEEKEKKKLTPVLAASLRDEIREVACCGSW